MVSAVRLVIAHDDALVSDMVSIVCAHRDVEVVASVAQFDELITQCRSEPRPDVALTADSLGETLVEEALDDLFATDVSVVVLSSDPSPDRLAGLLATDISGYISYDATPDEVALGIAAAARGDVAINAAVMNVVVGQWRRLRSQPLSFGTRRRPTLTPRELDILAAMVDGLAAKAIAARLGVALKTVENHKVRIFEKLGVRSHAHAVTVAMAHGLARPTNGWL